MIDPVDEPIKQKSSVELQTRHSNEKGSDILET
jgi:hypothetical protein